MSLYAILLKISSRALNACMARGGGQKGLHVHHLDYLETIWNSDKNVLVPTMTPVVTNYNVNCFRSSIHIPKHRTANAYVQLQSGTNIDALSFPNGVAGLSGMMEMLPNSLLSAPLEVYELIVL